MVEDAVATDDDDDAALPVDVAAAAVARRDGRSRRRRRLVELGSLRPLSANKNAGCGIRIFRPMSSTAMLYSLFQGGLTREFKDQCRRDELITRAAGAASG